MVIELWIFLTRIMGMEGLKIDKKPAAVLTFPAAAVAAPPSNQHDDDDDVRRDPDPRFSQTHGSTQRRSQSPSITMLLV